MFTLSKSPMKPIWRSVYVDVSYPFPASGAKPNDPPTLTDEMAVQIVARAKRRFDMTMKPGTKPSADSQATYMNLVRDATHDLKGFCFVAADEFESYFAQHGLKAKCVRVAPEEGGGDHYFTVVNLGSKSNSLIVDGTWRQFYSSGDLNRFRLVGTLIQLRSALQDKTKLTIDLIGAYEAGLRVVDTWKKYQAFA